MATAPAKPRVGGSRKTLLYVAGAAIVAAAVFLYLRRSSSGTLDQGSGHPSTDNTGSSAQQPNGGASSGAGQLPVALVSQPDALQQQVQQSTGSSVESPASFSTTQADPAAATTAVTFSSPFASAPTPLQQALNPSYIAGQYYAQSAPGSDAFVALPTAHAGTPAPYLPASTSGSTILRGGVQPV